MRYWKVFKQLFCHFCQLTRKFTIHAFVKLTWSVSNKWKILLVYKGRASNLLNRETVLALSISSVEFRRVQHIVVVISFQKEEVLSYHKTLRI
jgi:hypothetical protein